MSLASARYLVALAVALAATAVTAQLATWLTARGARRLAALGRLVAALAGATAVASFILFRITV